MSKKIDHNEMPCEIIQDLLPSYVDGLTSSVSNEAIKEHISSCEECKKTLEAMTQPTESQREFQWEDKEIDYLKQVRKKNRRIAIFSIVAAIVVALGILFVRLYVFSNPVSNQSVTEMTVEGNQVSVTAMSVDSAIGISQINFEEENGIVKIGVRGALVSPWNKGEKSADFEASQEIERVYVGDQIFWDHGTYIDAYTSRVFSTAHPYIGDMSANGETIQALGIANLYNISENELQTSTEPYGWTMNLQKKISTNKQEAFEEQLTGYGSILIALIDNLSEVTFNYQVEGVATSFTITKEDATAWAQKDIKECGKSVEDIQELLYSIQGVRDFSIGTATEENSIRINITPNIKENVSSIGITYFVDQVGYGTQVCQNADGSFLKNNESIYFDFLPQDFDIDLNEVSEFMFQVRITSADGEEYVVSDMIKTIPQMKMEYTYSLEGSCKDLDLKKID